MPSTYDWPAEILRPAAVEFNPRGMGVQGPPSLSGRNQYVGIDTGYWVARLTGVRLYQGTRTRVWRAVRGLLEGGANSIRVPVVDSLQAPWPGSSQSVDPVPFDTGDAEALFGDGTGFHQPVISIVMDAAAAAGATQIVVDIETAAALEGGEYFSVGDRLHVIKKIVASSGTQRTLAIWPKLRSAVPSGFKLNFDAPVCRMRLANERDMDFIHGRLGFSEPDAMFIEVV